MFKFNTTTGVLPLELDVSSDAVIPLPVIIDSGAPGALYLGTKSLSVLNDNGVLKDMDDSVGMYR